MASAPTTAPRAPPTFISTASPILSRSWETAANEPTFVAFAALGYGAAPDRAPGGHQGFGRGRCGGGPSGGLSTVPLYAQPGSSISCQQKPSYAEIEAWHLPPFRPAGAA